MNTSNTQTEDVAALAQDFKNSVLIVSLFVNLATLVTWLTFSLI